MAGWKRHLIRTGLDAIYLTGSHHALRCAFAGVGVVLTLHRVRPALPEAFQPNRLLEITPEFLAAAIQRLRAADIDFVSLDEVHRRLVEKDFRRRFVALTIDDGFRDIAEFAYPILRRFEVPFAVFVAADFAEGTAGMWWVTLENVVAAASSITVEIEGTQTVLACSSTASKCRAFNTLYWWLRTLDEAALRRAVCDLAGRHGVACAGVAGRLCLNWSELVELARDPLCTIGAHTLSHPRLRQMPATDAREEMARSLAAVADRLGRRTDYFAYPVGDATSAGPREFAIAAELGIKAAFTTRPGVLFPEHRQHLMALPRVSINGEFQALRYLDVLVSGVPFALWNNFRRVDAA
ncbi:MAG: polysaccharide deacetylase family protein [Blastochloris sp.]|nr:polysaccharide deacetylase family protein [Blastochloris sp.]